MLMECRQGGSIDKFGSVYECLRRLSERVPLHFSLGIGRIDGQVESGLPVRPREPKNISPHGG